MVGADWDSLQKQEASQYPLMGDFFEEKFKPQEFKSKLPVNPLQVGIGNSISKDQDYLLLDPKRTVAQHSKETYRDEMQYFSTLALNDVTQIGPERVQAPPAPSGTQAIAASQDGSYFAMISKTGLLRLYSSRELVIRGMAMLKSEVSSIKFMPGMMVCLLENGTFFVFLTEVRQPIADTNFPPGVPEIVPLYTSNRNMGGLVKQEGIVRYTSVDQLLFSNQFQHQLVVGDSTGRVHSLNVNFDGWDKQNQILKLREPL